MSDVVSLPNVILSNSFDMIFPNPPSGDGRALTIRGVNGVLPGLEHPMVPVTLHRFDVMFAGHRMFNHAFNVSFIDTQDRKVMTTLMNWLAAMNDPGTGWSNCKANYASIVICLLYSDCLLSSGQPEVYENRTFHGVWPAVLNDQPLDGGSDQPAVVNVTFCYDYWLRDTSNAPTNTAVGFQGAGLNQAAATQFANDIYSGSGIQMT